MPRNHRLVVVDHSTETTDVLRAVFQPRGVSVERRRRPSPKKSRSSDVFVLDEDSLDQGSTPGAGDWSNQTRVLIGSATHADREPQPACGADAYLTKPFQYSELIQAIEQLLAERDGRQEKAAA